MTNDSERKGTEETSPVIAPVFHAQSVQAAGQGERTEQRLEGHSGRSNRAESPEAQNSHSLQDRVPERK